MKEAEQVSRIKRTRPSIKPELDLRGVRYEDAMREIENYLDNAILSGFPQVSIIHGKGTGALRQGATEYLDRKSTRLNSSHVAISYAVFCLKKKKITGRRDSIVGDTS